jgi:hypothetical protein
VADLGLCGIMGDVLKNSKGVNNEIYKRNLYYAVHHTHGEQI